MMKDLADETVLECREMSTTTRINQEESSTVRSAKKVGIEIDKWIEEANGEISTSKRPRKNEEVVASKKNKNTRSQNVRDDFSSRESTPCPTRSATYTLIATPNMTPNINQVQEHVNNNQEPSLRRSPRKKKRVSYVEVDEEGRVSSTASQSAESHPPRTPPQAPRDLSPLMNTPNKRPLEREIQQ
ncbi:hypothetical protein RhiirC2_295069 [Rhizophagus irregularis]|uniref:Uncharacterized protein n=1 Tax=Rhizophagus irregularis TaxID=588596 RepID=A0A2N1MCQ9_9GLOM|nr:hypothetical protein RhiirC2_295069 [Rhizophagus irregularis]